MKKALFLALGLILGTHCFAATTTPRTGMTIPSFGDQNWDVQLRQDFNIIDASMCVQSQPNNFTGLNTFNGLTINYGSNLQFQTSAGVNGAFLNNTVGLGNKALTISAPGGLGIGSTSAFGGIPTVEVYTKDGNAGGSFAVIGSSVNGMVAYSGFIATSPISQSTLWSLPSADGAAGQSLVTDGLAHLSWANSSGASIGGTVNSSTQYSFPYYSLAGSSNVLSGVSAGTANQILSANGSSGPPGWVTPPYSDSGTIVLGFNDVSGNLWFGPLDLIHSVAGSSFNTAIGINSMAAVTTGIKNTAVGFRSLNADTGGSYNNAFGQAALFSNVVGSSNDAVGFEALEISLGSGNDAFGYAACINNEFGNNDICIGNSSNVSGASLTNAIAIGAGSIVSSSNTMQLGGSGTNSVNVIASTITTTGEIVFKDGTTQITAAAGGSFVQNSNTLQSGSAFYVSSGTVQGPLYINSISNGVLSLNPGNGSNPPDIQSSGNLRFNWTGTTNEIDFYGNTINGIAAPSFQASGTNIEGKAILFKQSNSGFNYSGFQASNTVTNSIWTLPNADSAGLWQSDGAKNLSISTTVANGSGLAVTYGLSAGSITVNGTGNFSFVNNADGLTYQVVGSSVVPVVGDVAVFGASNTIVDGGTGGSGLLSSNNSWTGTNSYSSLVTVSTSLVTTGTALFSNTGLTSDSTSQIDIYHNPGVVGENLLVIGSQGQTNQILIPDQGESKFTHYGAQLGSLHVGNAGIVNEIVSAGDGDHLINFLDGSSNMTFETRGNGQNFVFTQANGGEQARFSNQTGFIASSSATFKGTIGDVVPTTSKYELILSTSAVGSYSIAVSTIGHILSQGIAPGISSCGSTPNGSVIGNDHAGLITIGGGSVTGCTLTFAQSYGSACSVVCTISDSITTTTPDVVATPTTMTLGFSASIGGGVVSYNCEGVGVCQ